MNEPNAVPPEDFDQPQIMQVRVTNQNSFTINDRFDGVPYAFPSMLPVDIPVDAAHHIFGWYDGIAPAEMRLHVQRRFGWNTPDRIENGSADLFFEQLHIRPIKFRLTPVEEGNEEPRDIKRRTNKLMAAADERAHPA